MTPFGDTCQLPQARFMSSDTLKGTKRGKKGRRSVKRKLQKEMTVVIEL